MSPKSFLLDEALHAYLMAHSTPIDAVQKSLIEETAALGDVAGMQIAPEQGIFMTLLCRAIKAKQAIEVGTFTGYSSLCIARGLQAGGKLLCCDVSEEWTSVARRAWERAGVSAQIELRLAPAVETLRLLPEGEQFDFAFIDADKVSYRAYAQEIIPRLRRGGIMLFDNVLWGGGVVAADAAGDPNLDAIRDFNDWLATVPGLSLVMLPIADGLTMAIREAA